MLGGYATRRQALQTSQFDNMARQVREVFPSIPLSVVIEDLQITNSVELTIDNIVEGRLTVTPDFSNESHTETLGSILDDDPSSNVLHDNDDDDGDDDDVDDDIASGSSDNVLASSTSQCRSAEELLSSATGKTSVQSQSVPVDEQRPNSSHNDDSVPRGSGCRFSKSPTERESMLALRKENMLEQARRRYMARESQQSPLSSSLTSSTNEAAATVDAVDTVQRRRELVYHAVQRRLNSSL